jgi:hypothetical protein
MEGVSSQPEHMVLLIHVIEPPGEWLRPLRLRPKAGVGVPVRRRRPPLRGYVGQPYRHKLVITARRNSKSETNHEVSA